MEFRRLGNSDLKVSELALGSWLTFAGGIEEERAATCLRRAFELGVNFIDTANIYGVGASESALGRMLKDYPRKSYVLGTKLYFAMSDTDRGLSADSQAARCVIEAPSDRLRRRIHVPSLRRRHAAGRNADRAERGRAPGKDALHWIQ